MQQARGSFLLLRAICKGSEKSCRGGIACPPLPCHNQAYLIPRNRFNDHPVTCYGASTWKNDLNLSIPFFPDYETISVSMFTVRNLGTLIRNRIYCLDLSIPHHPEGTTVNISVYFFPVFFFLPCERVRVWGVRKNMLV